MNARRVLRVVLVMTVIALLAACVTPPVRMDTPEGFARYIDTDDPLVVSPEGVVVRPRLVDNDPPQTLKFWSEALKRQLELSGYLLIEQSVFETSDGEGVLFEWVAPVNGEDWIYLTGIVVAGEHIAIVEAAGPFEHYERYRAAIRKSLSTLRVDTRMSESD